MWGFKNIFKVIGKILNTFVRQLVNYKTHLTKLDNSQVLQIIQYCKTHQQSFISSLLELLYKQAPYNPAVQQLIQQKAKKNNPPNIQ